VESGGSLIVIGRAARIAASLGIHAEQASYNIPGSIVRAQVDNTTPIGFGFEPNVDVFFDNSPIFRLAGSTATPVARFDGSSLRSGWARGQEELAGALAAVDAPFGRGRVITFGPQIAFRAQSHATFKFLFNAIYYARAEPHELSPQPSR
jgi:hypothetical protein